MTTMNKGEVWRSGETGKTVEMLEDVDFKAAWATACEKGVDVLDYLVEAGKAAIYPE